MDYDVNDPDYKHKDDVLPDFNDTNKTYLQFLEGRGAKNISPLSAEGQELQAKYLAELGDDQHPLDVLRKISLNPFAMPKDRISASKALLEYTMVKAPSKVEVSAPRAKSSATRDPNFKSRALSTAFTSPSPELLGLCHSVYSSF